MGKHSQWWWCGTRWLMQPRDLAMGVPQKSMVEIEILKFGEAEEKIKKMNRESELKRREKGENGEIWILKFAAH